MSFRYVDQEDKAAGQSDAVKAQIQQLNNKQNVNHLPKQNSQKLWLAIIAILLYYFLYQIYTNSSNSHAFQTERKIKIQDHLLKKMNELVEKYKAQETEGKMTIDKEYTFQQIEATGMLQLILHFGLKQTKYQFTIKGMIDGQMEWEQKGGNHQRIQQSSSFWSWVITIILFLIGLLVLFVFLSHQFIQWFIKIMGLLIGALAKDKK